MLKDSLIYGQIEEKIFENEFEKKERSKQLHIAMNAILQFVELYKELPKLFNQSEA